MKARQLWLGLPAIPIALTVAWLWHISQSNDCEPSVRLVLLARGEEPWMWSRAPAHYRLSATGPELAATVRFDQPFVASYGLASYGSPRLGVWFHEKGVVAFELRSPPPRYKLALDLDGARVFEHDLAFRLPKPCEKESVYVELPPAVADLVDGKSREPEAAPR